VPVSAGRGRGAVEVFEYSEARTQTDGVSAGPSAWEEHGATCAMPRPGYPKRAKPKGASSGRRPKPVAVARDSRKGESPEAAVRWAGPARWRGSNRRRKRHVGASPRRRGGYLSGGESSEGRIPGALPACKKAGAGLEGVSRREGNQTLRAERSGARQTPRDVDLQTLMCCREPKLMRGAGWREPAS
jgi:hypothetical protein